MSVKRSPAQKMADKNYEKKRTIKTISFKNEEEADLIAFIESLPNFAQFIKDKIKDELKQLNSR